MIQWKGTGAVLAAAVGALSLLLGTAATRGQATAPAAGQDDGQWTMPGKNTQLQRNSGLKQITTENAKNLQLAWTFSTGVLRGHEEAPLVVGDMMYLITPFPNLVYALKLDKDPKKHFELAWKYDPAPSAAAQGVACCDTVNRGLVYDDGKLIFNTLDCHTICLDSKTGKELWKTKLGDINLGETITMSPLVVKGKVYVGNSGGEMGVRGWLTALDEKTGKTLWRAYSTGPDKDVLIGSRFKPYYQDDKGKDLGVSTWPPDHWKIGGGTVWGFVSYDPESNLIYYGTSNPGTWNAELRPGENKWASTVFARDADTGEAVWAYQFNPHDLWDHDGINEMMLLDLPVDGPDKPLRKVLVHCDRNGYLYVMDRLTGQVLSATQFAPNTIAKGFDLKEGKVILNEAKTPHMGKTIRDVEPASPGAKDWQPTCWSPWTKLLYIPHNNLACDYETVEAGYIAGTPYLGVNEKMYAAPPGDHMGELCAWDLLQKKKVWAVPEHFPCWSGTIVTAGNVLFYGTMDGYFKAMDATSGKELWSFRTGSGIICQPTTFLGPDGKQYVAIVCGVGGWAGAIVAGDLDAKDGTAALGFVNATKDLPKYTAKDGTLYVFALP